MAEENNNMSIWQQVCITDKDTTKPIEGKGFAGTSINPTSIYEKLTGLFGPCGIGWGYTVMDEYYREGHTDGENTTVLHVVKVGLWYEVEEKRSDQIEAYGQTYFCRKINKMDYSTKEYVQVWETDEECPKKSLTDAITKAASMLGVSADIYSGKWDGCKYQNKDKTTPTKPSTSNLPPCPKCGKNDAVIVSKFKEGEYVCFLKKEGCGAKFSGSEPPKPTPKKKLEGQGDIPYGAVPPGDGSKAIDLKMAIEEKLKEDFPKVFWKYWVNDHCIKTYGESKEIDNATGYHYNVDKFNLDRLEKVWAYINPSK